MTAATDLSPEAQSPAPDGGAGAAEAVDDQDPQRRRASSGSGSARTRPRSSARVRHRPPDPDRDRRRPARRLDHGPSERDEPTSGRQLDSFGVPKGPNSQFWFGADGEGRDLFVRTMYGARTSLLVGVVASVIAVLDRPRSSA